MPKVVKSTGEEIERLESIMERLRGENGCPWDKKQTHQTLRSCLLEESYEVLQAIDEGSQENLQEELGDVLLQVVFHAQLGKEEGRFALAEVIHGINEKMIRRHPHVFGNVPVNGVAGVLENWERIKTEEKMRRGEEKESLLDSVPTSLPALLQAEKVQKKAAREGFDWPNIDGPLSKIGEEVMEVRQAWEVWARARHNSRTNNSAAYSNDEQHIQELKAKVEEELGDLLFSMVNTARFFDIHPELALLRTIKKFRRRFQQMERTAAAQGKELSEMTLQEMDGLWEESKEKERAPGAK